MKPDDILSTIVYSLAPIFAAPIENFDAIAATIAEINEKISPKNISPINISPFIRFLKNNYIQV